MAEKSQLKVEGLAFAHSLQTALKTVAMYSVDHPAAEKALQHAYISLDGLLKQAREFTLGFMNQRIMLNNILTTDTTSALLQADFSRRGIGAVAFAAGISLREFKRGIALLSTKPKDIEENGGIRRFLERNPVEGMRILAAVKRPGETEDTDLQLDAQAYLTAQAVLETHSRVGGPGLDPLLQSVVRGSEGSPGDILELASKSARAALTDPERDLHESVEALSRMLSGLTPAALLSALPPSKQDELRGRTVYEVATDLVEDQTVAWAAERLTKPAAAGEEKAAQAEVLQGLLRGLQATQAGERLLQKLGRVIADAGLPPEVYERMRKEVMWYALSRKEKHAELMQVERFTEQEFRRMMGYLQEAVNIGTTEEALQVATRYWTFVDTAPRTEQAEELARVPELLRMVSGPQTLGFMRTVAARLCQELPRVEPADWTYHQRVTDCLTTLAQNAARYDEFELVQKIGQELKRSGATDQARHENCCVNALANLLTPVTVQRLVERYLEERDNPAWAKTVISLLKLLGSQGAETVFQFLEEETAAANRIRLIRLLGQLGRSATDATRKRLADERWYVVRNACFVMGGLSDRDLPQQLSSALRHPETRVQQAALTAIMKSQTPGRAAVLAEALPYLQAPGLDMALDELTFLKDPASTDGVRRFIFREAADRPAAVQKAMQLLAAIPSEGAQDLLGEFLSDRSQPLAARKAALLSLSHSPFGPGQRILAEFVRRSPNDPLAVECQALLGLPRA